MGMVSSAQTQDLKYFQYIIKRIIKKSFYNISEFFKQGAHGVL